jgi:hypothetical protein
MDMINAMFGDITAALDRLATVVKALNGGVGA